MAEEITQTHRKNGKYRDVSGYTIIGPDTELSLSHGLLMLDFKNNSAGKHAAVFTSFSLVLCQLNNCRNTRGNTTLLWDLHQNYTSSSFPKDKRYCSAASIASLMIKHKRYRFSFTQEYISASGWKIQGKEVYWQIFWLDLIINSFQFLRKQDVLSCFILRHMYERQFLPHKKNIMLW